MQAEIVDPRIELFEPKPGDGDDYVAVRVASGARYALTVDLRGQCAGLHQARHARAWQSRSAARRAFAAARARTGHAAWRRRRARCSMRASDKLVPVVQGLIAEYELDADQRLLIGEGGGAGALIPYISERLGLRCEISRDAEVISSIGAALALVRDVVERVIPHPQPEDLQAIRREALEAAVRVGADAGASR